MRKLLEVTRYGANDIRFNTDIDVQKNPDEFLEISADVALAMVTKLWGGNEISVLAVIRALAIADLAVSVNTKEMLEFMEESADMLKRSMAEAKKMAEKKGVKIVTFAPGQSPNGTKS